MSGVAVDPVTGRPLDPAGAAEAKRVAEEKKAAEIAGLGGIANSEAAEVVRAMTAAALEARIAKLLKQDDACAALLGMLQALGNLEFSAQQAAQRLTRKALHHD